MILQGWYLPVILIFWMLTQWLERTSVAATLLWSHLDSTEAKIKTCFSAFLLPAPPEKPSASHLRGWTAVTRWHVIPFSLWNISLIPSYSLTESSPLVAFLWVASCAYGHFPILSYKYLCTQIKGKKDHLLCSWWKLWRNKQTNKKTPGCKSHQGWVSHWMGLCWDN